MISACSFVRIKGKLPICNSNRLMQRRTKLYCSEMSKNLFSDYHDRGTSEPNGLEIMFTFILTLSSTLGWQ
ncbi:hypothetical protein T02_5997 [Trichinella nativa]|uniref:Uncharacterized protein n=1 Tax=Trichinella nativa TaxID=6335 RepID=A0A0V1L3U8_9BILA|nr:hypothetical protein T02_5997 [Trichinella nativa]